MTSQQHSSKEIVYRHNKRAKRLILRFDQKTSNFHLTIPPKARQKDIDLFLASSESWIQTQQKQQNSVTPFEPGSHIPFRGSLKCLEHNPDYLTRSVNETDQSLIISGPLSCFAAQVETFLKKQAYDQFLDWCQEIIGTLPKSIFKKPKLQSLAVRDTKSRWGSCTSQGKISLSWRLIMAPPDIARYVCIHECCHLIEMNHSPAFWALVERYDPHYKNHKLWLKKEGKTLFLYGS